MKREGPLVLNPVVQVQVSLEIEIYLGVDGLLVGILTDLIGVPVASLVGMVNHPAGDGKEGTEKGIGTDDDASVFMTVFEI
jgi:hypothetical protein